MAGCVNVCLPPHHRSPQRLSQSCQSARHGGPCQWVLVPTSGLSGVRFPSTRRLVVSVVLMSQGRNA